MSFNSFIGGDGFNADEARYNRQNRINQPEFPPTQTSDDIFNPAPINTQAPSGDAQGSTDIFNTSAGTGGNFDIFNQSTMSNGGMPSPMLGQPQQQQKSSEDKFYEAIGTGAKGTWNFFKDVANSFKGLKPTYWQKYGKLVMFTGIVCFVVGVIGRLFGWLDGLQVAIGGCLAGATGVSIFLLMTDKISKMSDDELNFEDTSNQTPIEENWGNDDWSTQSEDWGSDETNSDWGDTDSDWGDDEYGDEYGDDYSDGDDDWDFSSVPQQAGQDGMDADEAFNSMQEIPRGMITRQFLYENFAKVLPTITPGFSRMDEIDEDSDEFLFWDEKLREAAEVAGSKEEYLPELCRLQKNLFTIILTCDRPTGFKAEAVANELSNIYAYKDGSFDESVYATFMNVGRNCIITLFSGKTALITVKDAYTEVKDFVMDTSVYMPIVIGVDQLGKVICCDFKKIESCIIAGMPRSGKSWTVQAIITQMCAFLPPSELNFYIFDPKADTSDFKHFKLPHIKKFACRYTQETGNIVNPDKPEILATLADIVNKEAPRRKKLIGGAGCVNIWDYKKKYPDVKLPLLYVIIDEAVTLAEDMGKEEKAQYQSYVTQLITQFPNLGIRAFLIPHVVKNDIIKKTATDSMKCRISVAGSPDHIESSTGTKPKDFKYKLSHVGDMAVYMPDVASSTIFVHSAVLTDDNEKNNQIFDYLRRVWAKLEPEEVADSVAADGDVEKVNNEVLAKLADIDADDIEDLF